MAYNKMTKQMAETPAGTSIKHVTDNKKRYLKLLLLGDEQESMIDRYLERGDMSVMLDSYGRAIAVAVMTDEGGGVCEAAETKRAWRTGDYRSDQSLS